MLWNGQAGSPLNSVAPNSASAVTKRQACHAITAQMTDVAGSLYNQADASMEASEGLNPTSSQGYVEIQKVEAVALARAGQIVAPSW